MIKLSNLQKSCPVQQFAKKVARNDNLQKSCRNDNLHKNCPEQNLQNTCLEQKFATFLLEKLICRKVVENNNLQKKVGWYQSLFRDIQCGLFWSSYHGFWVHLVQKTRKFQHFQKTSKVHILYFDPPIT